MILHLGSRGIRGMTSARCCGSTSLHAVSHRPPLLARNTTTPQRRRMQRCRAGMHVPSDSFGGLSPERKAGDMLRTFFTFVAVKIVMAQMEGVGRGDLGSYNAEGYRTLTAFLEERPLKSNGDEWLAQLMKRDEMLAVRIMEVRRAYATEDFEWDNCQRVALRDMIDSNLNVMRSHAQTKFEAMLGNEDGEGGDGKKESPS